MRRHDDEQDIIGTRAPVDLGPLFASGPESTGSGSGTAAHSGVARPSPVRREQSPGYPFDTGVDAARKVWVKRAIETIAPALRRRAYSRGHAGVDCRDTRAIAMAHGLSTGHERDQRANSWWSAVPRAAGLVSSGLADDWTGTGNRPTKYLHPDFAREEGAA